MLALFGMGCLSADRNGRQDISDFCIFAEMVEQWEPEKFSLNDDFCRNAPTGALPSWSFKGNLRASIVPRIGGAFLLAWSETSDGTERADGEAR